MSERRGMKTEHAGAKNGGGFWGTRAEAKKTSRKVRRQRGREESRRALDLPPRAADTEGET